jgi:cytochrome c oxidase cbb3-type subunit 1
MNRPLLEEYGESRESRLGAACAAWHGLLWLVFANAVGVAISILLLFPSLNGLLGEWTYGRWIMVHMNLELFGWTSLPLAGFLFKVYGADREPFAQWCNPVLWGWSAALGVGVLSWLSGHSSGKLFLDWSGYARIVFPLAMLALWVLLALAYIGDWNRPANRALHARIAKIAGLGLLLAIPFVIYIASSPAIYPPINPDTGGPTGASQLESSLAIVLILLLLPLGMTSRKPGRSMAVWSSWAVLAGEFILCASLGRNDVSHHRTAQYLSLGSLLVWMPLTPAYYAAFRWRPNTRLWRNAFLYWWAGLILTGWIFFLPGVLDRFKFTDGLVGHSFIAMAGFTSSLLVFAAVHLLGEDAWIFNRKRSFYLWNGAVLGYIVAMTVAGWHEGFDPSFTVVPGMVRNLLYALRLVVGLLMLVASLDWFIDASTLLRLFSSNAMELEKEKAA